MPTSLFVVADLDRHRDVLLELNVEYLSWVFAQVERITGVPVEIDPAAIATENLAKVCGERPPRGVFYLLQVDGEYAGMGGLRYVRPGIAEIKRLYVRPAYRGLHLGKQMLKRLLSDAARFGYQTMFLDTGQFSETALHMYEAQGFMYCAPYDEVEVPREYHHVWRFMQRPVVLTTQDDA